MPHTTQPSPHPPQVTVPWGRKKDLRGVPLERAYETCQRGDKGRCINTNLVREFARLQGRQIRSPGTYKGAFHWSELIEDQWCMFVAPLTLKYAQVLDDFDHTKKHFRMPAKCPMGPVRFVGFSAERRDTAAQREERRARLIARVEDGRLVPGARFRERQVPYVAAPQPST